MSKSKKCCSEFEKAIERGTDNEGYGNLISFVSGEWLIGYGLDSISYCPWCGKKVN